MVNDQVIAFVATRENGLRGVRRFVILRLMTRKIAVTLEEGSVKELDRLVTEGVYPNRSKALQSALDRFSDQERRSRLARELAKLDPKKEQQLAEEGLGVDPWPAY